MNIRKLITAAFCSAIAISSLRAAEPVTTLSDEAAPMGAGLIGKRYVAASFNYSDVNHSDVDSLSAGARFNLPVAANFDMTFGYGHSWAEGRSEFNAESLSVSGKYYFDFAALKPFIQASLGHVWPEGDSRFVWATSVGAEYSLSEQFALTASGGYSDDFEDGGSGVWGGGIGATYWLDKSWALTLSTSLSEGGSVGYGVGAAFRF